MVHIKKMKKKKVRLTYTQFQGHISHEFPAGWITTSPYYICKFENSTPHHTDGAHNLESGAQSGFQVSFVVLLPIPGYLFIPY